MLYDHMSFLVSQISCSVLVHAISELSDIVFYKILLTEKAALNNPSLWYYSKPHYKVAGDS